MGRKEHLNDIAAHWQFTLKSTEIIPIVRNILRSYVLLEITEQADKYGFG